MLLVTNREPATVDALERSARALADGFVGLGGATAFVAALRAAADPELDALLADRQLCNAAAGALVSLVTPLVWSGATGDVGLTITPVQAAGTPWHAVVRFADDGVRLVRPDRGDATAPDVALRLDVRSFAALAGGGGDGALLYLGDRLQVEGDTDLLLSLGTTLGLIDPAALAPEAVSAAIKDVSTDHLDAVMAGGFRDLVLSEVFRRLPDFLIAEKAARVGLTVAFEIEGGARPENPTDRYLVRIAAGTCTTSADPTGESAADVTLVLTGAQFLRLVLGHLNPVRAVLGGHVRVRGELMKALAFNSLMRIPGI